MCKSVSTLNLWFIGVSLALKGSVLQQLCETTWDKLRVITCRHTSDSPLLLRHFLGSADSVSLLTGWRWMPQDVILIPRSLSANDRELRFLGKDQPAVCLVAMYLLVASGDSKTSCRDPTI